MTNYTIAPATSISVALGNGLSLGYADQLTILPGAFVATSDATASGVVLFGGNLATIQGAILGAGTGLRVTGEAYVTISSSGAVTGGGRAIWATGAGERFDLTNSGEIRATGTLGLAAVEAQGFLFDIANYGLIAAADLAGTDGRRMALSLTEGEWLDFANGGQIDGSMRAEGRTGFRFWNSGTITQDVILTETTADFARFSHFGGTGRIDGQVRLAANDLMIDLGYGEFGAITAEVQTVEIYGNAGKVSGAFSVTAASQGGWNSFVHMANLSLTRFDGPVTIQAPTGLLDLDGTVMGALSLSGGALTVTLQGATVASIASTASATVIDATGATAVGQVTLGAGNDTFTGHAGADLVLDQGGADRIDLGAGNDRLVLGAPGEAFNDTLEGGAGEDWLDYAGLGVAIKVDLSLFNATDRTVTPILAVGVDEVRGFEHVAGTSKGDLLLGDAKANTLWGNGGNDRLTGRDGRDTLNGGAGNDTLLGGTGADVLTGGSGADVFHFRTAGESKATARDLVTDFQTGLDRIDLREFDADPTLGGFQAFGFGAGPGMLAFSVQGTLTLLTGDVIGTGDDFALALQGSATAADVLI